MEIILFALLGWFIGILVNRAADNLPAHRSLLAAPLCPFCGTLRPVFDQFSVLKFLALQGRCSHCHAPIFLRAPIVEIATSLLFVFLWSRYGPTVQFLLMTTYSLVFLLVLVTDLEHRLIFNVVILPAIVFAALASPLAWLNWKLALVGGVCAFMVVFGIYWFAQVFARLRRINIAGGAFGQGDVKLAVFMGLVVGFPNIFPAILYTILLGGVGAIGFLAYQLIRYKRLALTAAIPYGPYFCIAGWAMMIFVIPTS